MFNFDMSINEALKIQNDQIAYYAKFVPGREDEFAQKVQEMNDLEGVEDYNEQISISDINARVPRGVHVEKIIEEMTNGSVRFSGDWM